MIRIATFDIETTHLCADFGIILCAVVKSSESNAKPVVIRGDDYASWDKRRSNDRETVMALRDELDRYDVLVAHNGLKFDLPFIRTRLAKWGRKPLSDFKIVDPVQLARNKFRMSYNSLEKLATFLDCNSKTKVEGKYWLRAALDGDRKAMNYIVKHCVEDVATLEQVVDSLKSYSTAFNTWGSGR